MAKIVVVEDDVYMREELLNLLEKSGYDTIGLSDFENAVSEIAAYFPDLILLDINLPFRSGFEICKELKAKQIGTVLVLTARDKLQDELHALPGIFHKLCCLDNFCFIGCTYYTDYYINQKK